MIHTYRAARGRIGPRGHDALLAAAFCGLCGMGALDTGPLVSALLVAIPIALVWGAVTLHVPDRVEVTGDQIVFRAYGRAHAFAWREVVECRVRRFLVRDRVLVRIVPSPPFRGRYWILDSIHGFDALLGALEQHRGGEAR